MGRAIFVVDASLLRAIVPHRFAFGKTAELGSAILFTGWPLGRLIKPLGRPRRRPLGQRFVEGVGFARPTQFETATAFFGTKHQSPIGGRRFVKSDIPHLYTVLE